MEIVRNLIVRDQKYFKRKTMAENSPQNIQLTNVKDQLYNTNSGRCKQAILK